MDKLRTRMDQINLSGKVECNETQNTFEFQGINNQINNPKRDSGMLGINTCSQLGPEDWTKLGWHHLDQFGHIRNLCELEEAIKCFLNAVASATNDHLTMARRLGNLGTSYSTRFNSLGDLEDLDKSIEYRSRALTLIPNGHSDMPHQLAALGLSYLDRFRRLGVLEDLENSVEYGSRALALTPDDHPYMPRRLADLGISYIDRFKYLGKLEDLEKSIEYCSRALTLTPDGHLDMPCRLADLGVSYLDRFSHLGELVDLEKSIEYGSRALVLAPDRHPDIPHQLTSLGISYGTRFQHLGELLDLEKSIEYFSHALTLIPDGHPQISHQLTSLGISYGTRFQHLGELADLERAIDHFSRALALTPDGHPYMPHQLTSLGVSYLDRYQRLGKIEDMEKSIEYRSRALALTPDSHPDMPRRLADLGVSYRARLQHLGEPTDLEKAIEYFSHALALTPNGHPDLPRQHSNLALCYLSLFQLTGDLSHSDKSLRHFRRASQLLTGAPRDRFQFALRWAECASHHSTLNLMEAYQVTIDLLPQFVWLGATTTQRYQDLLMAENLGVNAANAAICSSNYPLALEWLEHTRCVVWSQNLTLRSPVDRLHSSHPDLASRLQSVARQLHCASSEPQVAETATPHLTVEEQTGQQRRRLALEYQETLVKARQLPGFEDFLQPIKANDLICAAQNGPIVVINSHKACCDALLILPGHDKIGHIHLPNFSNEKAQRARSTMETSLRRMGLRERGVRIKRELAYKDGMSSVLATLWNNIVKPVLDFLGYMNVSKDNLPHITWCPTGALSFLPLHAAGDYDQPGSRVFDYVVSSYTPTLTALLSSTSSSISGNNRLLAVGQANTPGCNPLPGTDRELASVQAHIQGKFEYSQLVDNQATKISVLDAMEQYDWVHLACHAYQNVRDPTRSGFRLHDGTLELSAINQRSFKNKGLAFLSACQTATGDKELPDEVIHLASGMLTAGYPSVIATMWSVVDGDAPLVADKVYSQLMKHGEIGNGEAGKALHNAVAVLREKIGEKEFGRWVPYIHIGS
ncbi:unnamed protein product [Rhizoctonia solani]|uniref:CHAT domain-containing protein n=1 Tax=Rhizoctonia solani TaxID=456999 RepID=A0A8H3CWI2_9AGAM|nr:unnamed protein product [Rhizoctonia solani]